MEELFVELVITDTTAATAKQCLQEMNLPVEDIQRYDYYQFSSDKSIVKDLMNMDIIANVNKHHCITQLPKKTDVVYIFVKDNEHGNGLLHTLKKLGLQVASIEKGVVWGLQITKGDRSIADAAAQQLLCNKHYQEYEIRG